MERTILQPFERGRIFADNNNEKLTTSMVPDNTPFGSKAMRRRMLSWSGMEDR